jgi:hypothetical protein
VHGPLIRDPRGALLTTAVIIGAIWASAQALLTDKIVRERPATLDCVRSIPSDDLNVAAWGTVFAVVIAFLAAAARRRRIASLALVVDAGFVVAWIVIRGVSSLDCVLAI